MAGALEAVDTQGVDADLFRLQGMTHGGALVDDLDAVFLEQRHVRLRVGLGRFHDSDAFFDGHLHVFVVGTGLIVGRMVRLTPNGLSVSSRVLRISPCRLAQSGGRLRAVQ